MSLYIGKLSARTRKDELQRIFRKYGQCDVRLKDGYGFVVYDYPPDAENALSALHGRNICGQQLNITWSNKQPRNFQPARGDRSYESRGRDSSNRKRSNDWRDHRSGFEQPDSDGGRLTSDQEMLDEGRDYHPEDMIGNDYNGEEHRDLREHLPRDAGDVVTKIADNGRWGEQVDDHLNDHDGMPFDHYEPYHGYDRRDKDGIRWRGNSGGSALGSSQEVGRDRDGETVLKRPIDPKFQQNCYSCGALGHKMRDCPMKYSSRGKFIRFDHSQDDDINKSRGGGKLERFGSKSQGNTRSSRPSKLRQSTDGWTSNSGKLQVSMKNGNSLETDTAQENEHAAKKRSKRETRSPKRHSAKKSKRLASPSFHSEYNASRSYSASKSSKSLTRSISLSRSRSVSAEHSMSSILRSSSKSRYPKSRSSKSRSRSSPPTSLSLSVSLGRPASSPSKAQVNRKESVDKDATPESKDVQGQQVQEIGGHSDAENTKLVNQMANTSGGNAESVSKVQDDTGKNQNLQRDENILSRSSLEATALGISLPEIDAVGTGPSPPEVSRETLNQTNSDALATGQMVKPTAMPDSETPKTCHEHKTSISLEEMRMALKHYGVELAEESEKHTSLESLFGSARMWPWESIYYRRVKRGPILVENYARRVAQNQEFGIVDKYIRSSSGWGEIYQDNP